MAGGFQSKTVCKLLQASYTACTTWNQTSKIVAKMYIQVELILFLVFAINIPNEDQRKHFILHLKRIIYINTKN
ncbi:hypothetical protein NPIL_159671 [Nephila pilipes]|uniref:Uncharacterized protein n=1 Tax=Nephila pilipes TaxID=299642 RepID=A0A8X6NYD5_NEPPI|nr:hypothetical protein NPIL_159671 [Nephila pilipes]